MRACTSLGGVLAAVGRAFFDGDTHDDNQIGRATLTMGASQSSQTGAGGGGGGGGSRHGSGGGSQRPKTADGIDVQDYYGLLELPEPASATISSDEIRKAYRRLALRFHPDKNPDNVEAANERFRLIQAAYEVLSDEQERAWYDAHREQIMGGHMDADGGGEGDYEEEGMDEEAFQSFRSGRAKPPPAPKGSSLPGLTARQLLRFLDASLCMDVKPPSADETGFYGTYRRVFERLAEEEKNAAPYPGEASEPFEEYPTFGYSHTPYLHGKDSDAPIHQTQVRDFYAAWSSFSTQKGFGWRDGYRLQDAPDRRVKRAMEKENRRMREAARREYNDTVRSLALFIRKRDPRFKAHIAATQSAGPAGMASAQEMRRRREAADRERREQEERARAYRKQTWDAWERGTTRDLSDDSGEDENDSEASFGEQLEAQHGDHEADRDGAADRDEGADANALECFACEKTFQSEAAYANHERSNKHKKQVRRIQREMRREDCELHSTMRDVHLADSEIPAAESHPPEDVVLNANGASIGDDVDETTAGLSKKARQRLKKRMKDQEKAERSAAHSPEPVEKAQSSNGNGVQEASAIATEAGGIINGEDITAAGETTDKKSRRSKKDTRKNASAKERCNVCSTPFGSRSKLFAHIRESGHALAAGMGSTTNGVNEQAASKSRRR